MTDAQSTSGKHTRKQVYVEELGKQRLIIGAVAPEETPNRNLKC